MNDMKRYRKIIDYVSSRYETIPYNEGLSLSMLKKHNTEELDYLDEFRNVVESKFKKDKKSLPDMYSYNIKNFLEDYINHKEKILPQYATDNEVESALINLDFEEYDDVDPHQRALDFYNFYITINDSI